MLETNQRKTVPPPARAQRGLYVLSLSGHRLGEVVEVRESGEFLLVVEQDRSARWLRPDAVFTVDQHVTLMVEWDGIERYMYVSGDSPPGAK
jgi:hypothetical protein